MKEKINRMGIINIVLWVCFVLAMVSSVKHIAWTFGTVEQPGSEIFGWIPAIAVDAGLAALAYTIQQRKKVKRGTAVLWVGVVIFVLISALANLYHALAVESGGLASLKAIGAIDPLLIGKAVFLSATLPALVVYLSEIVSSDDAAAAKESETKAAREIAKAEREQARLDKQAEAERLKAEKDLLEAQNEQARLELERSKQTESEPASEPAPIVCENCGRSFRSINAKNAHKCEGKRIVALETPLNGNGKSHEPIKGGE